MFAIITGPVENPHHAVTSERLGANACPCEMTIDLSSSNHAKIRNSFHLGNNWFEPVNYREERRKGPLGFVRLHRPEKAHGIHARVGTGDRRLCRNVDGAVPSSPEQCGTVPPAIALVP